jgi:hypothetical protein
MDDLTRQALKRGYARIANWRWTRGTLFDGYGYCLLGAVDDDPLAVDELAKVLGFRRLKWIRIARWNDSQRRSEEVASVLRDALEGRTVCRTTGTAIDDLDLRPPHLRRADACRDSGRPPLPIEETVPFHVATAARAEENYARERNATTVVSQPGPGIDREVASGLGLIAVLAAITGRGPRIAV